VKGDSKRQEKAVKGKKKGGHALKNYKNQRQTGVSTCGWSSITAKGKEGPKRTPFEEYPQTDDRSRQRKKGCQKLGRRGESRGKV